MSQKMEYEYPHLIISIGPLRNDNTYVVSFGSTNTCINENEYPRDKMVQHFKEAHDDWVKRNFR